MPPIEDGQSLDDLAGLLTANGEGDGGTALEAGTTAGDDRQEHVDPEPREEGDNGNPDEGTEPTEGDEGEGDDTQGHEGDEEPSAEPFYTVKIDGKDERVTLKEALAGYQRQADYTRKTQEVAEARKALDGETAQVRTHREAYGKLLEVIQARLGPEDGERTPQQWDALRAADPAQYASEWTDFQRRTEQRNAVKAEKDRLAQEAQAEDLNKFKAFVLGEREKLQAALPVLKDREKGPKEMQAIRDFAKSSFGYQDAELDRVYDHRLLLIVNMARQWDNHQKALATAKQKVQAAPRLPEPGARQQTQTPKAKARAEQMKRFEKSGRIDDAVSLITG